MYVFINLYFGKHACKNTSRKFQNLTFNTNRMRNLKLTSGIIQYKSYTIIQVIENYSDLAKSWSTILQSC